MFDGIIRVNKLDPLPRHIQVKNILRALVTSGRLKPGDKIPAELEIAAALGVSKMTVNKAILALTGEGYFIREVGRGTFVAAVQPAGRNGAPPAPGAAAPQRRPRIALSFVDGATNVLDSWYYGPLYRAVCDTLGTVEAGVDLTIAPMATTDSGAADRHAEADASLFIAPRAQSIPAIEALAEAGHPVVVVGASWPGMRVPSVDSDNIGGAIAAVSHLARRGHYHIALFYAEAETANTQDRIVGYRRALSAARLPHSAEWEVESQSAWRAGDRAKERLKALLAGPGSVTAIFAAGHFLALEAMNAAREAGLGIPEDVSIVGFDDPTSAQLVFPPLTTVRQPLYEMGRRAAEQLLDRLRNPRLRGAVREILPAELVVRSSTLALPIPGTNSPY